MTDYILRDDAIQAKCENLNPSGAYAEGWNECNGMFVDNLLKIPAADVQEAKRGHWEWNDDNGYYYCPFCKSIAPKEDQDGNYYDWVNYCPNCGALMDKDGDA